MINKLTPEEILEQINLASRQSELYRARSVTVGTAFGGALEINMRMIDGSTVHAILQPPEAIELIHQMAASVGCHLLLKPRDDFSSWRIWKEVDESKLYLQGDQTSQLPPGMLQFKDQNNVTKLTHTRVEENLQQSLPAKKSRTAEGKVRNKNESLAVEKNINQRKSKRTTTPT